MGASEVTGETVTPRDRPLLGRAAELELLAAALARAAAGDPAVAVVSGEAGMGKTRLVRQLALEAAADGALVLEGACVELTGPAPYLPLVEALRRAMRTLPAERLDTLAAGGGELGRLVPELARGSTAQNGG